MELWYRTVAQDSNNAFSLMVIAVQYGKCHAIMDIGKFWMAMKMERGKEIQCKCDKERKDFEYENLR